MTDARQQAVYADGRWNGKTLREWIPEAVDDIVKVAKPRRVILFGSVAKGEEGPDSDLDFLVALDELEQSDRMALMGRIRFAISAPAPIDVFVTDVAECELRKDVIGSMRYWPLREGVVVHERPA
jgi:predicted nucleotidyltransferase